MADRLASALARHPRRWLVALAALTAAFLIAMAARTPVAHGDSGEYLLTVEAFANHATPDVRTEDVTSLSRLAAPPALRGEFGRLGHVVRQSPDGAWYTYHFWGYPLAVLPLRLVFGAVGANPLAAAQVTNALLLAGAAWFVLLAPWLDPQVARWWAWLAAVGPAAWFCVWPHPDVFAFSLVTVGLACAAGRRFHAATAALALASMQSPPLAPLALASAAAAASRPGSRARNAAFAILAVLPAFVPPAFYLLTFGRPSLILGESASFESVSAFRAAHLLADLNLGLVPYMPGVVALALAALVRPMRDVLPAAACWCAFAIGALGTSSVILLNTGTSGPSRYAVWLSPFLIWPAATWATRRGGPVVLAAALAWQAAVVAARVPAWGEEDQHRHSLAARFVLERWPDLYAPDPEVFRDRTPGLAEEGPYVFRAHGRCRKALAQKRHADALAAVCGPLPAEFHRWTEGIAQAGRGRSDWRYVSYADGP